MLEEEVPVSSNIENLEQESAEVHTPEPAPAEIQSHVGTCDLKSASGDPSFNIAPQVFFDQELGLEFRNPDVQVAETRMVRLRMLMRRDGSGNLEALRFEIFDDSDLYYFLEATVTPQDFAQMKEEDQLLIGFEDLAGEMKSILLDSLSPNSKKQVIFMENQDGGGSLEFAEMLELKAVDFFKVWFSPSPPDFVQKQAQYRYNRYACDLSSRKFMIHQFAKYLESRNPILFRALAAQKKGVK
jgi:hypothetical protein